MRDEAASPGYLVGAFCCVVSPGNGSPFPRISYDEAVEMLKRLHKPEDEWEPIPWGEDFGAPHETALTQEFDRPVFRAARRAAVGSLTTVLTTVGQAAPSVNTFCIRSATSSRPSGVRCA